MRRIPWIVCWLASLLGVWILSAHLERSRCGVRPTNASTGEVARCRPTSPAVLVGRQHVHGSEARAKQSQEPLPETSRSDVCSMHQPASVDDDAAQVESPVEVEATAADERRLVKAIETSSWFDFEKQMSALTVDGQTQELLDSTLIACAAEGRITQWNVGLTLIPYLRRTNRMSWPEAKSIVESGMGRGGSAVAPFAELLARVRPHPDRAYVEWALSYFEVPEPLSRAILAAQEN